MSEQEPVAWRYKHPALSEPVIVLTQRKGYLAAGWVETPLNATPNPPAQEPALPIHGLLEDRRSDPVQAGTVSQVHIGQLTSPPAQDMSSKADSCDTFAGHGVGGDTSAQELTDADIIDIRDSLLPSQGESFDCIRFARAILSARTGRLK